MAVKVGDRVAYQFSSGRWMYAIVTDKDAEGLSLEAPWEEDQVHLLINLTTAERRALHASRSTLLRLNVPHGEGIGNWRENKPKTADADFEELEYERAIRREIGKELMTTGTIGDAVEGGARKAVQNRRNKKEETAPATA